MVHHHHDELQLFLFALPQLLVTSVTLTVATSNALLNTMGVLSWLQINVILTKDNCPLKQRSYKFYYLP
jgi:hypothetical protein